MQKITLLLTLATALAVGGCRTTGPTTVEKRGSDYLVTPNSMLLNNNIRVTEYVTNRKNGLLHAQIRGQNISKTALHIEYRFEWMDGDGTVIESQMSPWKPLLVAPSETCFMNGLASSAAAVDFLFAVRLAQ